MMKQSLKSKLDLLNHKIKTAKLLNAHLEDIEEEAKTEEKAADKQDEDKEIEIPEPTARQRQFIQEISKITAYKTGEHYQLELAARKINTIDKELPVGMVHYTHFQLAKKRMKQVIHKTMADIWKLKNKGR